jgi:hypothetical protein
MSMRRTTDLVVVPVRASAPALFEAYPPEIVERSFALWSTIAGRCGARVVRLLAREQGDEVALPTASTVNRWALNDAWAAKADADLEHSHGKTLHELRVGWLAALRLSQQVLLDGMAGELDELPYGGAGRLKAAEITLRVFERAGWEALLPKPNTESDRREWESLTLEERESFMRGELRQRKGKT